MNAEECCKNNLNAIAASPAHVSGEGLTAHRLMRPVSILSLIVFRVIFGMTMTFWAFDYLRHDRVRELCAPGVFHFTYSGFSWVAPWPGNGMVFHFAGLLLAAIMIALGAMYRTATICFAVGFTHFFLIDRTNYQNHYYLIVLISWLMVILPAHRACSVDVLNGSVTKCETIPQWCLWLLQFHIALPYVFGGIAKIEADWLSGEPMRHMLGTQSWINMAAMHGWEIPVSRILTLGGLLFDLLIVPAMLYRRTRKPAFLIAVCFHVTNSLLFNIHIFPWMMIAATTVFLPSDWPARVAGVPQNPQPREHRDLTGRKPVFPVISRTAVLLIAVYCCFHLIWPFRRVLYEGNTGWTERGHYFSWRMMLRGKTTGVRYYLTDSATRETKPADIRGLLNSEQQQKFAKDPEMILDLAHEIASVHQNRTGASCEVRVLALSSLNGRKPQLLVDPEVNLAAEPAFAFNRRWIVPLHEPLRNEPWTVPLDEWERHADIPSLPFLNHQTQISANNE